MDIGFGEDVEEGWLKTGRVMCLHNLQPASSRHMDSSSDFDVDSSCMDGLSG